MKIVFYSTNSNVFDGESIEEYTFPTKKSIWDSVTKLYPQHEFYIVTAMPGKFLLDVAENSVKQKSSIHYEFVADCNTNTFVQKIVNITPDIVIAATFWVTPYDWLSLKDSLVAQALRLQNINVICQESKTSLLCFDKYLTHQKLQELGFSVPKAILVKHDLFWCERAKKEIVSNVYKEYILQQIQSLKYPLVIKDTVGLSSYGMEVVNTYNEAKAFLCSKKNNSDRIVEEYVCGLQFGLEIYGYNGNYTVLPPFLFSVNKYGITSPKQSVKIGPVTNKAFNIECLKARLNTLAKKLHFCGVTQIDLVFKDGFWYIIEINPRLSGMSETYAASLGKPLIEILLNLALAPDSIKSIEHNMQLMCNFKLPILPVDKLQELYKMDCVKYVSQIHNKAARQEREKGYGEVVFGGNLTPKELIEELNKLVDAFPEIAEPVFIQNAKNLASVII